LTNDQIKQYVLKCPSDFGGSKTETELACQLFPQKFKDGLLVYNKLSYKNFIIYKKHMLRSRNLSVMSTKCNKFTLNESKICDECNRLKNNSRFRDAISAVII
jgi:hypothetical protein